MKYHDELRNKSMNRSRSELYDQYDSVTKIDKLFLTQRTEDIMLYANFTGENFGIVSNSLYDDPELVLDLMLKDSSYGIDYFFLLGPLTSRPLDKNNDTFIQLDLMVLNVPRWFAWVH